MQFAKHDIVHGVEQCLMAARIWDHQMLRDMRKPANKGAEGKGDQAVITFVLSLQREPKSIPLVACRDNLRN